MIQRIRSIIKPNDFVDYIILIALILTFTYVGFFVQEDMRKHIIIMRTLLDSGSFPVPPLYYAIIFVFTFFIENIYAAIAISAAILGIMTFVKFKITKLYFREFIDSKLKDNELKLASISMLVVISIISSKNLMVGELSANVWHNSTTAFLFPFSLLLFLIVSRIIKGQYNSKYAKYFIVLIVINALIKPSYLFVFSCLPIFYFFMYGWNKKTALFTLGSFIAVLIVASEFAFLFLQENDPLHIDSTQEKNSIILHPFDVWKYYSTNILISLLSGLAFPLFVLISGFKKIIKDSILSFAWIQLILAITIFALFKETGSRMYDGNMVWQIFPSMYILFLFSVIFVFNEYRVEGTKLTLNGKFLLSIFGLHVISGIVYLGKICFLKSIL